MGVLYLPSYKKGLNHTMAFYSITVELTFIIAKWLTDNHLKDVKMNERAIL